MVDAEIDELWTRGQLRAACDASTRWLAQEMHPFRDGAMGGGDDLATATRWHDHGSRCWHLARLDECGDALERAYSIRSARLGRDHLDTLATLERLAALAHYGGDQALASNRWHEVIDTLDDVDSPRGRLTAIARRNFASFHREEGDVRTARQLLDRARAVFERSVADDDLEYLALRKANAMLAFTENTAPVAVRLAAEAIAHSPLVDDHPFKAAAKFIAARAALALRDDDVARSLVEEVIASFERGYGDHPLLALAISFHGSVVWRGGELDAARPLLERAYTMYRRFYPTSPSTRSLASSLHGLLRDLGDTTAADALGTELREMT